MRDVLAAFQDNSTRSHSTPRRAHPGDALPHETRVPSKWRCSWWEPTPACRVARPRSGAKPQHPAGTPPKRSPCQPAEDAKPLPSRRPARPARTPRRETQARHTRPRPTLTEPASRARRPASRLDYLPNTPAGGQSGSFRSARPGFVSTRVASGPGFQPPTGHRHFRDHDSEGCGQLAGFQGASASCPQAARLWPGFVGPRRYAGFRGPEASHQARLTTASRSDRRR